MYKLGWRWRKCKCMRTYIFSGKARAVGNLGIGGATCSIQFYLTRILGKKTKQCHNAVSIRLFSFAASTAGKVPLKKVKLYLYVVPKCICNKARCNVFQMCLQQSGG